MSAIIAVAPMMGWTDRHCRYFHRLLAPHAVLYTEMITTGALLYGDASSALAFDVREHPVALQLGGSDPVALAHSARLGADQGYDEINLNVGCPSPRVTTGRFGACLMFEPRVVAACVAHMKAVVKIPVTVKCRIGVDTQDSEEDLHHFIQTVAGAGCDTFIVHARKALTTLNPKENRMIPPLQYDRVYRLKKAMPHLKMIINGGIKTQEDVRTHLQQVEGVMIGREAYQHPYVLAEWESQIFKKEKPPTRKQILQAYREYAERQLTLGERLNTMTRHLLGLFHGLPGARQWRHHLSEQAHKPGAGWGVVERAAKYVLE